MFRVKGLGILGLGHFVQDFRLRLVYHVGLQA